MEELIAGSIMEELIAGSILTALSSYITYIFNKQKTRKEIKKIRRAYNLPAIIPLEDNRNTILLIGIGGVGKTSLIKQMLDCDSANPQEKTKSFKIYWQRVSNGQEKNKSSEIRHCTGKPSGFWYFVCDYCGQNIGSLFRSFIEQQKREYSPIAYGYVNSLILMVDLFPPPEEGEIIPNGGASMDTRRIAINKCEWNNTAIDAVFGLLTNELRYVCLFINKIDLMEKQSEDALKVYKSA